VVAIQMPTDEEMYLLAFMDDPSGIDLAEFLWVDEEQDDRIFRCWDFQWCLTGETELYTDKGRARIEDVVGPVRLLTAGAGERGVWVDAEVRDFGTQQVWEVELVRRNVKKTIRCTSQHTHFAGAGKAGRRTYVSKKTWQLKPGDFMQPTTAPKEPFSMDRKWVQSGIVFGDGTAQRDAIVRLYGAKMALASWFDGKVRPYTHHAASVPAVETRSMPADYKTRMPEPGVATVPEMWGWLAGYFATDGSVLPDGTCVITCVKAAPLTRLRDLAMLLGVAVGDLHCRAVTSQPPGSAAPRTLLEYRVTMRPSDLPPEFFLLAHHRARRVAKGKRSVDAWRVVEVRQTNKHEPVYCAVVEGTHSFVLDGDILTGNCWYLCTDVFQIDKAARSMGKSVGIQMRAFAFPFNYPGSQMLVTAPELNHLRPLTDAIEARFLACRLGDEMLPNTKGKGIARQPHWQARFLNGAQVVSRLPNKDGRGIKGMHPLVLEMDEGQDYPPQGWIELIETVKRGSVGAQWRAHGVSRGVRDKYFELTEGLDPNHQWTVHKKMAMHRHSWSAQERKEKISTYGGSEDNPDYRRNIYGEHGDATNPLFVVARLMQATDTDEGSEYNTDVYTCLKINAEFLVKSGMPIEQFLQQIPATHRADYRAFWAGADIGFTNDPTEILLFGQPKDRPEEHIRLLLRIQLSRISAPDQERVFVELFRIYGDALKTLSLDKTGNGLPIYQHLKLDEAAPASIRERIKGYNFAGKYAVEFDDNGEDVIEQNIIMYASDKLREYVDTKKMSLPFDRDLLAQWQGQTVRQAPSMGGGVRMRYSKGGFHLLDAAKMMISGKTLEGIETALAFVPTAAPVLDAFYG
jgi:hypothetical protein